MGESFLCTARSPELAIFASSEKKHLTKDKPAIGIRVFVTRTARTRGVRVEPGRVKPERMEPGSGSDPGPVRIPLAQVVSDCVKRWFEDTLKEAKAGDVAMQVLVGQMYCSGYGVSQDQKKGRGWINRASKIRSSALQVSDKRPGYNASDSDSVER